MLLIKQNRPESNYVITRILAILAVIMLGSLLVYGINSSISRTVFFSLILFFFIVSKDDVLTVAIFFILSLYPWFLFYVTPYDNAFQITSTVGLNFTGAFSVAIIVKYIYYKGWRKLFIINYLTKYYRPFVFYFLFLILWSLLYGFSSRALYDLFVSILIIPLFFIITRVFDKNKMLLFNKIMLGFCLLHSVVFIINFLSNGYIWDFLSFGRHRSSADTGLDLVRIFGGVGISLYSMAVGFYYLVCKDHDLKSWYLWLVILASLLQIFNTGTRGWMIASIFVVVFFFLFYGVKIIQYSRILPSVIFILLLSFLITPDPVKKNLEGAFTRLSTVETVLEGDMTAGGTAKRWDQRGPIVLSRFNESPLFGFGFSKIASEYYDHHVGNHTILLTGGFLGITIIWLSVLSFIFFLYKTEKRSLVNRGVFIFGILMLSLLIIHSTNQIVFSFFRMPLRHAFLISIILNNVNCSITKSG